ncbi:MAG: DUF4468 domain-containing protein [Sphingobacteriales bacterium]|nr:DUF4468 domain-containing protein [Sphingobacteriales bacterium]
MRRLIILLQITLFSNSLFCQTLQIDSITKKGYYEKVITTKGTKDQLYTQAKAWVFKTFKSGNAVIQDNDKEAGRIYGEAITNDLVFNNTGYKIKAGYFKYSITILVKDDKTKITLDNITFVSTGNMGGVRSGADIADEFPSNWMGAKTKMFVKNWDSMKEQAEPSFQTVMRSYELAILETQKKNDW